MKTSMKRALLGTTAVVGLSLLIPAPVSAEPVSLSISGDVRVEFGLVNQDDESASGGRSFNLETDDAGVNFKAKGEADNGLKYGAKIEVDTDASSGALAIDELMLYFSGEWGRLELGNEDGAADTMLYGGESLLTGIFGFDGGSGSLFDFNGVTQTGPNITESSDGTKMTYYTPRMNGFQMGASYTPDTGAFGAAGLAANVADSNDIQDHIELGANFVQSFDDVTIKIAAVYSAGEAEAQGTQNTSSWQTGGVVSFGDFSMAAGYGNDGKSAETGTIKDKEFFDVSGSYSSGPYTVAIGYFTSSASTGVAGEADDEVNFFTIGANYSAAPGLSFYGEFDIISVDQNGTGDGVDNDGTVFVVGTKVAF